MSRNYAPTPDFAAKPNDFIKVEGSPWPDATLLLNGLWVTKNKYVRRGVPAWELLESGAGKNGSAQVWSAHSTKRLAILAGIERKPFEDLPAKAKRVEAAAQAENGFSALAVIEDLLGQCTNLLGPIDEAVKYRLRSYVLLPTLEGWCDVHGTIVAGFKTVWQIWGEVSTGTPRSGPCEDMAGVLHAEWDRIPTPTEMVLILHRAVEILKTQKTPTAWID